MRSGGGREALVLFEPLRGSRDGLGGNSGSGRNWALIGPGKDRDLAISLDPRLDVIIINGLPYWLYVPLWLPMQLGNLVVGTLAGLAVALVDHDWAVAIGVLAAMAGSLTADVSFAGVITILAGIAFWTGVKYSPGD